MVETEALEQMVLEDLVRPTAEMRSLNRLDPIPNGNNDIKIVIVCGFGRKIGISDFSHRLAFFKFFFFENSLFWSIFTS